MATAHATTFPDRLPVPSLGLRPFFLLGALHGGAILALWLPWFLGFVSLPAALPPLAWHAHELLFGFVPAIVAGFLLTAVPSWTGRADRSRGGSARRNRGLHGRDRCRARSPFSSAMRAWRSARSEFCCRSSGRPR